MKKIRAYFTVIIAFLLLSCTDNVRVLHVSPSGSDKNDGNLYFPLQTVSKAIEVSKPGQTICIHDGVYREKVLIPEGKNGIKLVAYKNEKPVLKGSDVIKDWEKKGDVWFSVVKIKPQQVMVDGDNPLQQIGYPNDDFRDVQNYPRYEFPVGKNINDMAPGRFFWVSDTLFIMLNDKDDPRKHQIEVSVREYVINVEADSVLIKGLTIRHSNSNTYSEQGAAVSLGNHSVIEDCDVQWCDFGGISMGYRKKGSKVIRCVVSHNGATGINASATEDFLIKDCKANYNNCRNFYAQWHAGGFKGASSAWGTIENSEFAYNTGAGIWFDYCYERAKYRTNGPKPINVKNNYIHNNSPATNSNQNAALMIEVSEMANLINNVIINNGLRAVYISASWDVNVLNNTICGNYGYCAIDVAGMPRKGQKLENVIVANNIISENTAQYDIHIVKENGDDIRNISCDYNLIFRKNGKVSLWHSTDGRGGWKGPVYDKPDDWKKNTLFDHNSVFAAPEFKSSGFGLTKTSPAVDAGTLKIPYVTEKDFCGHKRVSGRSIDMGACEYYD
ncbi:MAG: right-handed parallel beta-helix repeat-containing protein [Chlorobi bacterium]|nr:right-handed parallel beta-helix repeat-containing protein [Chlorobiota bacterium]